MTGSLKRKPSGTGSQMNSPTESTIDKPSYNEKACTMEALHEVRVLSTEVIVTVDLPLTEESSLQVRPAGENTLEVSARMRRKVTLQELGLKHRKAEFERLHCHLQLPVPVKMDKLDLHFRKGLLQIHIPRKA